MIDKEAKERLAYCCACLVKPHQVFTCLVNPVERKVLRFKKRMLQSGAFSVYDFQRNCNIEGRLPHIFDSASNSHILLRLKGNECRGIDVESKQFFHALVMDSVVRVFDSRTQECTQYIFK